MIIGVSEKNGNISQHLLKREDALYIDVDILLNEILSSKFDLDIECVMSNRLLKAKLNALLELKIMEELGTNSNLRYAVIKYSMLSDLNLGEVLDLSIEAINENTTDKVNQMLELYVANYQNKGCINSNRYQLTLDMNGDWQKCLDNFIAHNIEGENLVSVIIPVYNTSDSLIRCVESVSKQTYRNIEILLIDDGSTDNSLELCKQLAANDRRIKVISQENKGLPEARNTGIRNAQGKYVCFVDSDDYIDLAMVSELLKKITETNSDVCECGFYIHQRNGDVVDVTIEQKGNKFIEGRLDLINAYSDATILIPAWDKMYKTSVLKEIQFTDECFKEDSDFVYRLCLAGKSFSLVAKPFYHYLKRKGNSITANKLSPALFTLREWGKTKYLELLSNGEEYRDAAEKILYNSLTHILRYYMRDYKNGVLREGEFQDEIQDVVNDITSLLLSANNIPKFRKLHEILDIINFLIGENVLRSEKFPTITIPCIGIIWNSMDYSQKVEAIERLKKKLK